MTAFNFSQINPNERIPGVYIEPDLSNAIAGLFPSNDKVLIIGQMTSTHTVSEGSVNPIFSESDAALYFGRNSQLHLACRQALITNPNINLSAMPISNAGIGQDPDPAGLLPQHADINTATPIAGNITNKVLYIDDISIPITLSSTDPNQCAVDIWTQAVAYINTNGLATLYNLANPTDTTVISVFFSDGAGYHNISFDNYPEATIVPAGTPIIYDLGDVDTSGTISYSLAATDHAVIVNAIGDTTSITAIKNVLLNRSSATENRPGIQVALVTDATFINPAAVQAFASTLNDGRTLLAYISYFNGYSVLTNGYLTSPSAKIIGALGSLITINSDPVVPYDGLVLPGIYAPFTNARFNRMAIEYMLDNGITPLAVIPGEQVDIVRGISTYTLNAESVPDPTLLDINTIRTVDFVQSQIRARLLQRFQRAKMSPRVLNSIKNEIFDVTVLLEAIEVLQDTATLKDAIVVEADLSNQGRANALIPIHIVSGLHIIACVVQVHI